MVVCDLCLELDEAETFVRLRSKPVYALDCDLAELVGRLVEFVLGVGLERQRVADRLVPGPEGWKCE